jgi:hypothetical protein
LQSRVSGDDLGDAAPRRWQACVSVRVSLVVYCLFWLFFLLFERPA